MNHSAWQIRMQCKAVQDLNVSLWPTRKFCNVRVCAAIRGKVYGVRDL